MDNAAIHRRAAANAISVVARGVLQAASIVLLTPMLVRYLGAHGFGLWSILYAFVPYAALFDLGISGALAKHLAELDYRAERDAVSAYLGSAIFTMSVYLICLGVLLVLARALLPSSAVLHQPNLGLCLLLFATALLANLSNYALMGLHRQDLASYMGAGFVVLNAIGTVLLLTHGGKVHALLWLNIAISVATTIVCATVFYRISRARFSFHYQQEQSARLLSTGIFLQLYGLASLFYLYLGKWIIAIEISIAAVTAFEIALRVLVVLRQGFSSVASPLMAAASRLTVTSQEAARDLFQNAFRYFTVLAVPAFVAAGVFSSKLIEIWMGTGHAESALVLTLLAPGSLFGTLSGVVWFVLVGAGKSSSGVKIALAEVIGGLMLCAILTARFGLRGAAISLTIPGTLALFLYLGAAQRVLGIRVMACLLEVARALAVSGAVMGVAAYLIGGIESRIYLAIVIAISLAISYALLLMLATTPGEKSAALRFARLQQASNVATNL